MFWKLIEFIVRVIYWRRFRTAKKIGEAAALLSSGEPENALALLEKHGDAVHQSLIPFFALTQGKIFEALGRLAEAEAAFKAVVLTNPKDARADVALAVLTGRQYRLEECRTWLDRAIEKDDGDNTTQAKDILTHLDAIEDGSVLKRYEVRAKALAETPLQDGKSPGTGPDLALLEKWVAAGDAKDSIDDAALLLAYCEAQKGGKWKLGLSIEDTVIVRSDGSEFRPFETIDRWLPAPKELK